MKRILNVTAAAVVIVLAVLLGRWTSAWGTPAPPTAVSSQIWTCPMHPQIRLPDPGDCPICGMDLVLAGATDGKPRIGLSPAAVALAQITTAPVERQFPTLPVRMVGKVDYDETRVRSIAARVGGRLDRLFVDYAGIPVQREDHLVSLYSPALLVAQQELLAARARVAAERGTTSTFLTESDRRGYEAAREKLLLWGLSTEQVDEIEARGAAEDHMLIRSPATGVVIQKFKNEGDYVQEGTAIYRIADLTHLWIQLDAYEQDLPWLRYGQTAVVHAVALPGEQFEGRISFLDPIVDNRTRTVRVRVDVDNRDRRLKPGMFVHGVVRARIGTGGQVLEPTLAGKWISPMHPEIVKDGPGTCDVCGMDLVPAESLGYVAADDASAPLCVPATAVLVTGTRAVAYVEVPGQTEPTYEGREVVLGPRAGDLYVVRSGLAEGERVVVEGAFRIDSAMQIQAKPSMMSSREAGAFDGRAAAPFRHSLQPLYAAYLLLQQALAGDDFAAARAATAQLTAALEQVQPDLLPRTARERWQIAHQRLHAALPRAAAAADLQALRVPFEQLSLAVLALERAFGHEGETAYAEAFCPMAFDDQGAAWLQVAGELRNPYFGAEMLTCGETRRSFPGHAPAKEPR